MQDSNLKTKESQGVKKRVTKPLVIPHTKENIDNGTRGNNPGENARQEDGKPL